jgi:KUP system potassium uptake protein
MVRKSIRVPGTAIFLTRQDQGPPGVVIDHVKYMGALQENVIVLTVDFKPVPRVAEKDRSHIEHLGGGVCRVAISFGFIEVPDLKTALAAMKGLAPGVDLERAIFFGARDLVTRRGERPRLPGWQLPLFAFLYRNAVKVVDRFNLPHANVLEIAHQIEI